MQTAFLSTLSDLAYGANAPKLEDISTMVLPVTFLFIIAFMVVLFSIGDL